MKTEHPGDSSNKQVLIKYWIEKALEALDSAKLEYKDERLTFAMNRIYYAFFYALTALFRDRGCSKNIKDYVVPYTVILSDLGF